MKYLLMTCDFEEFNLPYNGVVPEDAAFGIAMKGFTKLKRLIEDNNINITFFVTEKIVSKYPTLIKELSDSGHEIGLHGMIRRDMSEERVVAALRNNKEKIESVIQKKKWFQKS